MDRPARGTRRPPRPCPAPRSVIRPTARPAAAAGAARWRPTCRRRRRRRRHRRCQPLATRAPCWARPATPTVAVPMRRVSLPSPCSRLTVALYASWARTNYRLRHRGRHRVRHRVRHQRAVRSCRRAAGRPRARFVKLRPTRTRARPSLSRRVSPPRCRRPPTPIRPRCAYCSRSRCVRRCAAPRSR